MGVESRLSKSDTHTDTVKTSVYDHSHYIRGRWQTPPTRNPHHVIYEAYPGPRKPRKILGRFAEKFGRPWMEANDFFRDVGDLLGSCQEDKKAFPGRSKGKGWGITSR